MKVYPITAVWLVKKKSGIEYFPFDDDKHIIRNYYAFEFPNETYEVRRAMYVGEPVPFDPTEKIGEFSHREFSEKFNIIRKLDVGEGYGRIGKRKIYVRG